MVAQNWFTAALVSLKMWLQILVLFIDGVVNAGDDLD